MNLGGLLDSCPRAVDLFTGPRALGPGQGPAPTTAAFFFDFTIPRRIHNYQKRMVLKKKLARYNIICLRLHNSPPNSQFSIAACVLVICFVSYKPPLGGAYSKGPLGPGATWPSQGPQPQRSGTLWGGPLVPRGPLGGLPVNRKTSQSESQPASQPASRPAHIASERGSERASEQSSQQAIPML